MASPLSMEEAATIKAARRAWYKTMISNRDYTEFENFSKWLGTSKKWFGWLYVNSCTEMEGTRDKKQKEE
ncbi:60S ribosomal protein L4 [Acorus calamus]|uniref:60S ribosomal protein L4 n=1 Tax=Acorus calamus TaxID=4465 RepID=A0AAV9EQB4_ACOCL|nr:60S ribosomal protein L4 [Acorus calamus]